MDNKAMYKLSYGLFVLTTEYDGKVNGCITNTAIQVANDPTRISVAVNKANLTQELIAASKKFNISILGTDADFELSDQARLTLLQHRWEGNVRELENCIAYLKYTGLRMVDLEDLPDVVKESRNRMQLRSELEKNSGLKFREYLVLRELGEVYGKSGGLGRQALVARCISHGNAVSEHEVREILKKLDEMGLVKIRPGRGGTCLTEAGYLRYRQAVHRGEVSVSGE